MRPSAAGWRVIGAVMALPLACWVSAGAGAAIDSRPRAAGIAQATTPRVALPAPPATISELNTLVEQARTRFVARDTAGVLAYVAEDYRSAGFTKSSLRDQLLTLYALYDAVQARIRVDQVQLVDGDA